MSYRTIGPLVSKFDLTTHLHFLYRHPTSCCSAAEIMSVLFFNTMRYSAKNPRDPASDRFVMSKVGTVIIQLLCPQL